MKTFDILGIGCVAVDDLLYVNTYPPADAKVRIKRSGRRFGGLTGTALVAAAKLGGRCAFAGLLGEDELSKSVEDNFVRHGIDVTGIIRRKEARPIHAVIIAAEGTGTRNIFFDSSAPTGADPSGPSEEMIRSAKVLALDYYGMEGGIRAARIARDAGIPVVADLEDDSDPLFGKLLDLIDHLVIGDEFAAKITGVADPPASARMLLTQGRTAVVVTCGSDGAWYVARDPELATGRSRSAEPPSPTPLPPPGTLRLRSGQALRIRQEEGGAHHQPAFPVTAVDTTGCGDVFHGAYALALARGKGIEARVRFASAAAAIKATQSEVPSAEQVAPLMVAQADSTLNIPIHQHPKTLS
ncbi:MAG: PfkB family carbohydrate kinase [Fimbriimonadales bacterium]